MSSFQPPPTYAEVVLVDPTGKRPPRFNPIWLKWFLDLSKNLGTGGAGSVSSFAFTNANGISGSVANATTTPALTLALGAITPSTITVSSGANLISSSTAFSNGAGTGAGTLANAPAVGNPTKWIPINDNGTTRHIPTW